MKKILCIEPSGKLYGSELVLLEILKNKKNPEFSYEIILPPNSSLSPYLKQIGVKFTESLDINTSAANKILSYLKLFFYLNSKKVDLIFINQAGIIRPILLLSKLKNIPIVCEVSTLEDARWVNSLPKRLFKNVQSFICNSNFIAEELKVLPNKKSILYLGYHWKNINPTPRTEKTPFKIVLLGRISKSKGHFLVVEALKQLSERFLVDVEVFFVGDASDPRVEDDLKNEIEKGGLSKFFIFRGFRTDIESELSDKNLMIIPSLNEPFGRIFCEAAEANLPVIVADSGGLGELSNYFQLGIQFKGSDATDLADKLYYAYQNYEAVRSKFLQNSKVMLTNLDMASYILTIENIISRAMEHKPVGINWFGKN